MSMSWKSYPKVSGSRLKEVFEQSGHATDTFEKAMLFKTPILMGLGVLLWMSSTVEVWTAASLFKVCAYGVLAGSFMLLPCLLIFLAIANSPIYLTWLGRTCPEAKAFSSRQDFSDWKYQLGKLEAETVESMLTHCYEEGLTDTEEFQMIQQHREQLGYWPRLLLNMKPLIAQKEEERKEKAIRGLEGLYLNVSSANMKSIEVDPIANPVYMGVPSLKQGS